MNGALLVAGTTSDAGKSVLTAGLCRWFARQGISVAPFKAQNMSLNSVVTPDGAEIGRAQAMQAAAAGIEPRAALNPVLLKPGSDRRSQVVVLGRAVAEVDAVEYRAHCARLLDVALASLGELRTKFDVVICEGAGSPAEINLRATDIANMGLARAANLPVIVVGDIDRGGVFAALYGTLALLEPADQALICGFVINKFRGAVELLEPGLRMLTGMTGRPAFGTLPWRDGLWLDVEDSLALEAGHVVTAPPHGADVLRVAVVRLPRISNFTDIDALANEPGVLVRFAAAPAELADADLVVLPGSRATVSDLRWLHSRGMADVITRRAAEGLPILGICGGYQMLAREIADDVESKAGTVPGLGLLPVRVEFRQDKTLGRPRGTSFGAPVAGYEIHHGIVRLDGDVMLDLDPERDDMFARTLGAGNTSEARRFLDGLRVGHVYGTTWHGVLENDEFRRRFLTEVAAAAGRNFTVAPDTAFGAIREARLNALGDLVAEHLDTEAICRLIEKGPPPGLAVVPPAGPPR